MSGPSKSRALIAAAFAALTACQPQSTRAPDPAAVAEAPIRFETPKFHPPPRTTRDVGEQLAALDRTPIDCDEVREEWREAARYLDERANEANASRRLARSGRTPLHEHNFRRSLQDYAERALVSGGLDDARRLLGKAIDAASATGHQFDVAYFHSVLSLIEASVGDRQATERAVETTRLNMSRDAPHRTFDWLPTYLADFAETATAIASSDPRRAEAAIRTVYPLTRWPELGAEAAGYVPWLGARLVDSLLQQGRVVEAEIAARHALAESIRVYGNVFDIAARGHVATPLTQLAAVLLERDRAGEAETLAREAIDVLLRNCAGPDSLRLAEARRMMLRALAARGDWAGVVRATETIRATLRQGDDFERLYGRELEIGVADALAGDVARGTRHLEKALAARVAALGAESYAAAEARAALGIAAWRAGDRNRALDAFGGAVSNLIDDEQRSGAGARRSLRRGLLHAYLDLVGAAVGAGERLAGRRPDLQDSLFQAAQIAELQVVESAISAAGARNAARDPGLEQLVREAQDTNLAITALLDYLNHIASLPPSAIEPGLAPRLRRRLDGMRAAKQRREAEIDTRFPEYRELVRPLPMTIAEVQEALRDGEAMILIASTARHSLTWAITSSGAPAFAVSDLGRAAVRDRVERLRAALSPDGVETLADIPVFDTGAAYALYRSLLAPVEPAWREARLLFTVTPGALGALPLSALTVKRSEGASATALAFADYRRQPWLARTHAVNVLPAVSTLRVMSLRAATRAPNPFLGFGDPVFGGEARTAASRGITTRTAASAWRQPVRTRQLDRAGLAQLPQLPETAREITAIARTLGADPDRDVFLGARATETSLRTSEPGRYRVISFATHGLMPGDLDGLDEPALALTPPSSPGVTGDDGLLTLNEILGLDLNAEWAVLSACNTGAADGRAAEAVSGLGRAFFYAGARALLVSNWPVHSESTTELMVRLFESSATRAKGLASAEALRRASVSLVDDGVFLDVNGSPLFSYAHPIFWAPFTVVGDGRRP